MSAEKAGPWAETAARLLKGPPNCIRDKKIMQMVSHDLEGTLISDGRTLNSIFG